nr:hypothetical protein [uncultured Flavobacterium sp.]
MKNPAKRKVRKALCLSSFANFVFSMRKVKLNLSALCGKTSPMFAKLILELTLYNRKGH